MKQTGTEFAKRKSPRFSNIKFQHTMRNLFPVIAIALFALASCTRPVPPQKTKTPEGLAENISFAKGYVTAEFENGESVVIYFAGTANVLLPAKGRQYKINGVFAVDKMGWYCMDNKTGDHIHLRRNGFASGRVHNMAFNLMPKSQQPPQKPVQ